MSDNLAERIARIAAINRGNPNPTLSICRRLRAKPCSRPCRECPAASTDLESLVAAVLELPPFERAAFAARWWCHNDPRRPCAGMMARLGVVRE